MQLKDEAQQRLEVEFNFCQRVDNVHRTDSRSKGVHAQEGPSGINVCLTRHALRFAFQFSWQAGQMRTSLWLTRNRM